MDGARSSRSLNGRREPNPVHCVHQVAVRHTPGANPVAELERRQLDVKTAFPDAGVAHHRLAERDFPDIELTVQVGVPPNGKGGTALVPAGRYVYLVAAAGFLPAQPHLPVHQQAGIIPVSVYLPEGLSYVFAEVVGHDWRGVPGGMHRPGVGTALARVVYSRRLFDDDCHVTAPAGISSISLISSSWRDGMMVMRVRLSRWSTLTSLAGTPPFSSPFLKRTRTFEAAMLPGTSICSCSVSTIAFPLAPASNADGVVNCIS